MFDKTKTTAALDTLVGFRPSPDPEFFVLTPSNLESTSGYYINDNPFAELESYYSTMNYSKIDEIGFNAKLTQLKGSAITQTCNAVFQDKNNPDFVDSQLQFKNATNKVNLETLPNGFVGEKINIANINSLAVEISRVMLDFQGTGDITLYLFNTNSIAPIQSEVVTIASDHQVVELNWKLDNTDGINGGDYYIGYFTDGLSITPYKRDFNNSSIQSIIKHVSLYKTFVLDHVTPTMWDLQKNEGTSITTGMNLGINVYYDYTDFIIQNKHIFADAINLQAAILMLSQYKGSLRSNKNQRISQDNLLSIERVIEGASGSDKYQKITGLRPSYAAQLDLIKRKIDSLVNGVRVGRIRRVTNT